MEHEAVAVFTLERVDDLLVAAVPSVATTIAWVSPRVNSAEPWVRRQHAGANGDRPHGAGVATIDARLARKDLVAHDLGFEFANKVLDVCSRNQRVGIGRMHSRHDFGREFFSLLLARLLLAHADRPRAATASANG